MGPASLQQIEKKVTLFSSAKTGGDHSCSIWQKGILPQKHGERYKLRRLETCYFLQNMVLFKKGYDGDPLRCLGPEKAREMIKEVHSGDCREHQGKKKIYRCLLQIGYY